MIDLHTHSTASDGTLSPRELVLEAKKNNLRAIALTDHDTVSGLDEFFKTAKEVDIEVISGVELSSSWYHSEIHIVGLFIDYKNPELQTFLEKIIIERNLRNFRIIEKLQELEYEISVDDLPKLQAKTIGRPHIAQALVDKKYFPDINTAMDKLLATNRPAYVKRVTPSSTEVIQVIKNAGGIAIWAHPCSKRDSQYSVLKKIGCTLKSNGLDGIETVYWHFTEKEQQNAERFAKQYGLLESGGSDFHGENSLNVSIGKLNVPDDFLEKMKEKLRLQI